MKIFEVSYVYIKTVTYFFKKAAKALTNLCWSTSLSVTDGIWNKHRDQKLSTMQMLYRFTPHVYCNNNIGGLN